MKYQQYFYLHFLLIFVIINNKLLLHYYVYLLKCIFVQIIYLFHIVITNLKFICQPNKIYRYLMNSNNNS